MSQLSLLSAGVRRPCSFPRPDTHGIEEDLAKLDELELLDMVAHSREALSRGETLSHKQVKARLEKQHKTQVQRSRRAR